MYKSNFYFVFFKTTLIFIYTRMILLNTGGAILVPMLMATHLFFTVLVESWALHLGRYAKYIWCFLASLFANLVSLSLGLLILSELPQNLGKDYSSTIIIIIFLLLSYTFTVLVEGLLLWAMNRRCDKRRLLNTCLLMHLATYALLVLIFAAGALVG